MARQTLQDHKWIDDVGSESEDESVGCPSEAPTDRWREEEAKLGVRCASPPVQTSSSATVAPCLWLCATLWHTDVEPNSTLTLGPGRYSVVSAVSALAAIGGDVTLLSEDEPYCFELEEESQLTVVVDIAMGDDPEHHEAQPVEHSAVGGDDDVEVAAWRETLATASFSSMMRLLQKRRGVVGWLSTDGEATAVWRSTSAQSSALHKMFVVVGVLRRQKRSQRLDNKKHTWGKMGCPMILVVSVKSQF